MFFWPLHEPHTQKAGLKAHGAKRCAALFAILGDPIVMRFWHRPPLTRA